MKKAAVDRFEQGTFEYVVMHAKWQQSKGRNLSATLPYERNARRALVISERFAYFPENGRYLNGVNLSDYKCAHCGAINCKLWREYQACVPQLLCAKCAAKDQGKNIDDIDSGGKYGSEFGRIDQIGWYVPAVPTEDGNGYWGYTSVPTAGCKWWDKLPTHPMA